MKRLLVLPFLLVACAEKGEPLFAGEFRAPEYAKRYEDSSLPTPPEGEWREIWVVPNENGQEFAKLLGDKLTGKGWSFDDASSVWAVYLKCPNNRVTLTSRSVSFDKLAITIYRNTMRAEPGGLLRGSGPGVHCP